MHAAARRTRMLQQLREGLQLYRLVDIMEKNKEVCRSHFVFEGGNDQVRCITFVKNVEAVVLISGLGGQLLWAAFPKSIVS